MIKIEKTTNSTITVSDETGGVCIILGADCQVLVFDEVNMYMPKDIRVRTVGIYNKYNNKIIAIVNANTLDPASDNYSSDMDTYATNLRDSVLYV